MATQWSMWALTEVEPHTVAILFQKFIVPEDRRDPAVSAKAEVALAAPLKVLDDILAGREWLVGGRFPVGGRAAAALATHRARPAGGARSGAGTGRR